MRTYTRLGRQVTIPNPLFLTKSRFAYVKFSAAAKTENQTVALDVYAEGQENAKIILYRKTNAEGVAIFPTGTIVESLVRQYGEGIEVMFYASSDGVRMGGGATPIVGYSEQEITSALIEQATPNNKPAVSQLVLYPNTDFEQFLFIPSFSPVQVETSSGYAIYEGALGPFIPLKAREFYQEDAGPGLVCICRPWMLSIPAEYDLCTDGVFLKWVDKSGIPYIYRWTPETVADEMSVDSTYTHLDENLQPYEVQHKTLTRRYTLHSRIVKRGVYELCKTILGNQGVWMYDSEAAEWVQCNLEEGEAVDDGSPMNDLAIEVVRNISGL